MQINVAVSGRTGVQQLEVEDGCTPLQLLTTLGFYPDEVLIFKDDPENRPIPITKKLDPGDSIRITPVASGG